MSFYLSNSTLRYKCHGASPQGCGRKEEHRAVELLRSVKEFISTNIMLIICALPFQSQACLMLMQLMSQKVSTKEFQQSQ